ncbi:hypothetical protein LOTGIDRAFT_215991 [Lottia gigantea]|uniref:Sodium-dependent phosphate transport protein 2B n=1 Tax=Lottia gigantea TaxID=225164 RepID=V4AJ82_LOTGI|nr:hypothetical protein LOTGIDRAFT_215991 [Lottia gigantea]ESO93601.1 hypothetical protein LOTGIDRAFT_215991 [Lottia gigantea]
MQKYELQEKRNGKDPENGGVHNKGFLDDNSKSFDDNQVVIEEETDPWKVSKVIVDEVPMNELDGFGKCKRISLIFIRIILVLACLYFFICSLDFLSSAFKLLGGRKAGEVFQNSEILSNPVAGLMMGVLVTVLVQSSSTSTSIVISMVGAGILEIRTAIPIVMGANIGTSVTNTIVALGQITDKNEFRRAFAGATVHDMFNWMSVIVFLPLEIASGYLYRLSGAIINSLPLEQNKGAKKDFLKVITKPFTTLIIQVDSKAINKIAISEKASHEVKLMKSCCDKTKPLACCEGVLGDTSWFNDSILEYDVSHRNYLFKGLIGEISEEAIGAILLVLSLIILCLCLVFMVKLLNLLLKGQMALVIKKFINADFPGYCSYFTGYIAILLGAGFTILVQSSSIFTSSITPLVGMGVIELDRMYPLTLGANIGTTTTGILSALAQDSDKLADSLQVAFCHLFFNISGILLFYPFPFFRPPIPLAKFLGNETAKYRWYAIMYIFLMFFIFPAIVFALSVPGWYVLAGVLCPIALFIIIIMVIKLIQRKRPGCLPPFLRNWKFLPKFCRSLEPYDYVFGCRCCKKKEVVNDGTKSNGVQNGHTSIPITAGSNTTEQNTHM